MSPVLTGFQVNVTGAAVASLSRQTADATVTASSTIATATVAKASARNRLTVLTPVATAARFSVKNTADTGTVVKSATYDNANSVQQGKVNFLSLGWENTNSNRIHPYHSVVNPSAAPRLVCGYITAAGAITEGKSAIASVSKSSSVYTITFKKAFGRAPIVLCSTVKSSAFASAVVHTEAANQIKIATFAGASAGDEAFYFIALGWDLPYEQTGERRVIRHDQRAPRLEALYVTQSGGTYTQQLGGGSVTKTGTGDIKWTFGRAFSRAPVVVVSGLATRANVKAAASTADVSLLGWAAADGTTATNDNFSAIAIGWDHPVEN